MKFADWRKMKGFSLEEIAVKLGLTKEAIRYIELHNSTRRTTMQDIFKMTEGLVRLEDWGNKHAI
jgi:transcriptional regulator with XRE-family HTH domain